MAATGPVVLSTRDEAGNAAFARAIAALGGRTLTLPFIRIEPPADRQPLRDALASLDRFDWLVLTSAHAVTALCGLDEWPSAWSGPIRPRVAAVGRATADALRHHGIDPTVVGAGTAASLVEIIGAAADGVPMHVLWPRSDRALRVLPDGLRAAGATLVDPIAYCTRAAEPEGLQRVIDALAGGEIAAAAFFSPSGVRACADAFPAGSLAPALDRVLIASIGPTTSAAIVEAGGRVDLESTERSADGLARDIMARLAALQGART